MTTKTKMVISKTSLLAIKQRCLAKLDADATEYEKYLAGTYEFESRLGDALQATRKMDVTFREFSDETMDALQAAVDRLNKLLDGARDNHDRETAYSLFRERACTAIKDEFRNDEKLNKVKEIVDVSKAEVVDDKPAASSPPPAPPALAAAPPKPAPVPEPAPETKPAASSDADGGLVRRHVEVVDSNVPGFSTIAREHVPNRFNRPGGVYRQPALPPEAMVAEAMAAGGEPAATPKEIRQGARAVTQATAPTQIAPNDDIYAAADKRLSERWKEQPQIVKRKKARAGDPL